MFSTSKITSKNVDKQMHNEVLFVNVNGVIVFVDLGM